MKRYLIGLFVVTLLFFSGYWLHKPKTITIEKIKEVKVYDFTQEPKMMEYYANMMGKTLENKKDIEEYKREAITNINEYRHKIWQDGYIEGIKSNK